MGLVTRSTGTYDDAKVYSAWELCGDWWWVDGYMAVLDGTRKDRVFWETATVTRTETTVRLWRLDESQPTLMGLRSVIRYVHPDTPMRLVKVASRA